MKNSVRLTGFVGADPEIRVFAENKNMARVSLATNERYRNTDGDWMTDTQWHSLVYWGKNAVFAEKSIKKGSEISVEGRLISRQYEDKEGVIRYVTEVVVQDTLLVRRRTEPLEPEARLATEETENRKPAEIKLSDKEKNK